MGEQRIYKYELWHVDKHLSSVGITMPMGARVLSAGVQATEIVVWAIIDTQAQLVSRRFRIIPTGTDLERGPEYMTFIQTIFLGPLVFHVFDLDETSRVAG